MTFPSTHPALARALAEREYTVPTAVQLAVVEERALRRDLLVSAQTGSGKTVAFGLAMAPVLLGDAERFERAAEPLALIIAPTRELAMQVQRELAWLFAGTSARVVTCVGGMDARAEARQLEIGAHIVVGTPGRLRDHLERRRLVLTKLKSVVLDEADEMLDLGFREDLEVTLDATPSERQTLLFSATLPREIEQLARSYQRDAVRIETVRRDEQHADIEYRAIRVAPHDVENAIVNILRFHEMRATLVFCATREAVKRLHARLAERGFSAVALSGELTQHERTQALQALRDGRARVLVATDVAARGLDLPDLSLVIHADLPNDRDVLLHRSGRTGRAGKKGLCILVVPYNRRRKADVLLSAAKVRVTWGAAPTADEIRAKDQERFMADAIFTEPASEEDLAAARALQGARTADEISLALLRLHRTQLPAPEDLAEDRGPAFRDRDSAPARPMRDRPSRDREERTEDRPARAPRGRPVDERPMTWFRLNIGRDKNADPRWLLPLICRAGNVTKSEIGAIKIFDRDTRFEILTEQADQFAEVVRTNDKKEGHISRVGAHTANDEAMVTEAIERLAVPSEPKKPAPKPAAVIVTAEAFKASAGKRKPSASFAKPNRKPQTAALSRPKPSWQERSEKNAANNRTEKPAAAAAPGKSPSKYAHKKKNRQPTSAAG